MKNEARQAIQILKQGGIVIFPTDTVYGIGCRMDDETAVKKLFRIRKRPETQATSVLVSNPQMAQEYLLPIPEDVKEKLINTYWPGGLTIVLPCQTGKVLPLVRGGKQNLGIRMPDHSLTLALINDLGVPLLGPSANFHGKKTPASLEELDPVLIKMVDFVLPGECGEREASTVIDCSIRPWKILRKGTITNIIL